MMELNQLRQLRERWQPPPELARGRPRSVRFTAAGAILMVLAVTLLVAALLGGAWLWLKAAADSQRERLLGQESAIAEGRVQRFRQRRQPPYWAAPLVAASLAGAALLIARRLAGQRRLLAEGRPAPGIVTRLGRKSQYGREVRYEFPTLSGARASGKFGPVKDKAAPEPGSAIVVVYDPDEPRLNARYPMSLVKVGR